MGLSAQFEEKLGEIRVGLRADLEFNRVVMHGQASYIVHDPVSFTNHRFSVEEYLIITAIIETRSLKDTFEQLVLRKVLEEKEKDAFFKFVLILHSKCLLSLPILDADKLYERYKNKREEKKVRFLMALMYFKVPLFDPDRFLTRTIRYVRYLFSKVGIAIWATLGLISIWKVWGRLDELLDDASILLHFANVPILYVVLIGLKGLHELGHAYTCKKLGGAVPEIGMAAIMMTPCAYVDASSAWKFPSKWHRIAVSLGGMYIETFIAFIFALIWAGSSDGLLKDVCVNVVAIASVATIIFNLNPLMKFDGYYVLADLIGIPNLRQRGTKYLSIVAKQFFLGLKIAQSEATVGEQSFCAVYGIGAFLYKIMLAFTITVMVVFKWPMAGAVLGICFGFLLVFLPMARLCMYLWTGDETSGVRLRARSIGVIGLCSLPLALAYVPVSWNVVVPGILQPEFPQVLRAPQSGFVTDVFVARGQQVMRGQRVVQLSDPTLEAKANRTLEELNEARAVLDANEGISAAKVVENRANLDYLEQKVAMVQKRRNELTILTRGPGTVTTEDPGSLRGSFVRQGQVLLEVHGGRSFLRIVLTDVQVERAKLAKGVRVAVRWSVDPFVTVHAYVREIRPVAQKGNIPLALTVPVGGEIYAKPTKSGEIKGVSPYLHVFIEPESLPMQVSQGLVAKVQIPARLEVLGAWLRRKFLEFYNAWKMS